MERPPWLLSLCCCTRKDELYHYYRWRYLVIGRSTRTYRSKFEQKIADQLNTADVVFTYEGIKLKWIDPAKNRVYTPDYYLPIHKLVIETKGFWKPQDRLKMLLVKEQHPEYDIRMVFQDAHKRINKGSPTTYAMWCDKYGIKWAHKEIPEEWLIQKEQGVLNA